MQLNNATVWFLIFAIYSTLFLKVFPTYFVLYIASVMFLITTPLMGSGAVMRCDSCVDFSVI